MRASSTVVTRPASTTTRPPTSTVSTLAPVSAYTSAFTGSASGRRKTESARSSTRSALRPGAARRRELPHGRGVEPARCLVRKPNRADDRGDAHRLEEVLVVRAHRAIGAEPHGHAAIEQLAHRRDPASEPEIASWIVRDGAAGVREQRHVLVGEPD